jgi:hypothetical protein
MVEFQKVELIKKKMRLGIRRTVWRIRKLYIWRRQELWFVGKKRQLGDISLCLQ